MLNIFNKKKNNSKSEIRYLDKKTNNLGQTIYYPPASKEWFNSIYAFNKNYLKSLPVADKVIIKLIKSYFNFYSPQYEKKLNLSRSRLRFIRLSTNKIFVSRAELKHVSDKVIITLYIYNQQEKYFLNKLGIKKNTKQSFLNSLLLRAKKKKWQKNYLKKRNINIIKRQGLKVIKKVRKEKNLFFLFLKKKQKTLFLKKNNFKHYEQQHYKKFILKSLEKEILSNYSSYWLYFNKSKLENTYLFRLNSLICKIYKKKVEFNIVKLKNLFLNSDILSEALTIKLRKRENKVYIALSMLLDLVNLPLFNKFAAINNFSNDSKPLQLSKIKNLNLNSLFPFKIENKDVLHQLLQKIFLQNYLKPKNQPLNYLKSNSQDLNSLENTVLNSIKHKNVSGVRIETIGRLTKRFTAARSVFKFKHKGSLKNIDSSYKGLSSVMLRGYAKSNIQYTKISSKTRVGSFGVKGWVSSI